MKTSNEKLYGENKYLLNDSNAGNLDPAGMSARDIKLMAVDMYESCVFDQLLGDTLRPGGLDLTTWLANAAGVNHNHAILEIGCGKGTTPIFLAGKYGCLVTGIDLSEKMIALCKSNLEQTDLADRVGFILGDGESLPFAGASFDIVISECSFSLLPDKDLAAREIWRVLKPGGKLLLSDIILRGETDKKPDSRIAFPCCFTGAWKLAEYIRLFEQVGLQTHLVEDHSDKLMDIGFRLGMTFGEIDAFLEKLPDGPCKIKGTGERPGVALSFQEYLKLSRPGYALVIMQKRGMLHEPCHLH